jgi:hypothetical protein
VVRRRKEEINDLNTRIAKQQNNFLHIVFSSILYNGIGNQNFLNDKSATSQNGNFN